MSIQAASLLELDFWSRCPSSGGFRGVDVVGCCLLPLKQFDRAALD